MRSSSLAVALVLVLVAPLAAQQAAAPSAAIASPGAQPAALDARLSPDGVRVGFRAIDDGGRVRLHVLVVGAAATSARPLAMIDADSLYWWTPDGGHVLFIGAADGHLYSARVDAGAAQPARDLTEGMRGRARVVGFAAESSALVELPGRSAGAPDVYRIDLASGERALVARNPGLVRRWLVDDAGIPRAALRAGEGGSVEIVRVRGDTISPLYACDDGVVCELLSIRPDRRIRVRSSRGRSTPALVLLDPITLEAEVARSDLSRDPHVAFMTDSAETRDFALASRHLAGTIEFQPSREYAPRALFAATDSAGRALFVLDRWAGTVTRVLSLADGPGAARPGTITALDPEPGRLANLALTYRSTSDDGAEATTIERRIERRTVAGRDVWRVVDHARVPTFEAVPFDPTQLEDPDFEPVFTGATATGTAEAADTVLVDAVTLRPMTRRIGGPLTVRLDFSERGVAGVARGPGADMPVDVRSATPLWADGAALELLVAALPLAPGYDAFVPIFDLTLGDTVTVRISVEDAPAQRVQAGRFDVLRVTISGLERERPEEVWLVRRSAPHVVVRGTIRSGDYERSLELIDAEGLR